MSGQVFTAASGLRGSERAKACVDRQRLLGAVGCRKSDYFPTSQIDDVVEFFVGKPAVRPRLPLRQPLRE